MIGLKFTDQVQNHILNTYGNHTFQHIVHIHYRKRLFGKQLAQKELLFTWWYGWKGVEPSLEENGDELDGDDNALGKKDGVSFTIEARSQNLRDKLFCILFGGDMRYDSRKSFRSISVPDQFVSNMLGYWDISSVAKYFAKKVKQN